MAHSYKVTDYITATGSGAKEAYNSAKQILTAWQTHYNKKTSLLATKKYIIIETLVYASFQDVLDNLDVQKLADAKITEKVAACYILTDSRYMFVTFERN